MFARSFCWFLCLFVFSLWGQEEHWCISKEASGLTQEEQEIFVQALKKVGVRVEFQEKPPSHAQKANKPAQKLKKPYFNGQHLQACLLDVSLGNFQIGLVFKSLDDLEGVAFKEFAEVLRQTAMALEACGYGFVLFFDQSRLYKDSEGKAVQCFEILPVRKNISQHKGSVSVSFVGKIKRMVYMLGACARLKSPDPAQEEQFLKRFERTQLPSGICTCPKEKFTWYASDQKQTLDEIKNALRLYLSDTGALVAKSKVANDNNPSKNRPQASSPAYSGSEFSAQVDPGKCAFCNPAVTGRQRMDQAQKSLVLFNYLPYGDPHYMVIPSVHHAALHCPQLPLKELIQHFLLTYKVAKRLANGGKTVVFLQNSAVAGQSVPHTHIHCLNHPRVLFQLADIISELRGEECAKPIATEKFSGYKKVFQNEKRAALDSNSRDTLSSPSYSDKKAA